eukprot:225251-Pelagomonas_calceolata.AAC.2
MSKRKMLSASKIPMQDFIGDLRYRQQKVRREVDALSPQDVNRKAVTYHHWCGKPLNQTACTPFCIRSYSLKDKEVRRNMSRFILCAHCLVESCKWLSLVESCKWSGGSNIFDKCECAAAQDEAHALFHCNCFQLPDTGFIPFLASFRIITDPEIKCFQKSLKLVNQNGFCLGLRKLSGCMQAPDMHQPTDKLTESSSVPQGRERGTDELHLRLCASFTKRTNVTKTSPGHKPRKNMVRGNGGKTLPVHNVMQSII